MIGAELQVEAVLGLISLESGDPCIVDQNIERAAPRLRERSDRGQIGEIEFSDFGTPTHGASSLSPTLCAADRQDDMRPCPCERACSRCPDSAVASGDHHRAAIH